MFHEEKTKDVHTFDHDDCQCALTHEAREKLNTKGVLWGSQPQTCDCNKTINLPVPRTANKKPNTHILDNEIMAGYN